jgi:hypothetical protein
MTQAIPLLILAAVAFSLVWGLLALGCLVYRKVRGGERRRRLVGMAAVLTIALVGWTFIDDRPLPTYMNSVTSSGIVFRGTLVVEDGCVFIDLDEPGGDLSLLYFPALTTTGFDPATGTVRFAFGKQVTSGDAVSFVGGGTSPSGWVTRSHDAACVARADGFQIVERLSG